MLERMRRKGNPSALLVGMQTGAATVENSIEIPQKIKSGNALFTLAKIWKQPKCQPIETRLKKLWYIYIMEYYSSIKKKKTCGSMNGHRFMLTE